jgi:hypothetical protein
MNDVSIDQAQVSRIAEILRNSAVPPEQEASTHALEWKLDSDLLGNCYFAIVAICHQTSPVGEQRLQGNVGGIKKYGWDYLKERFFDRTISEPKWASSEFWATVTPIQLSELYEDSESGQTLNRVNERAYLLNDLGNQLLSLKLNSVSDAFQQCDSTLGGNNGFLTFLERFIAYRDPLRKKSLFYTSIATKECGWKLKDPENLLSPVDYHELRGHLRLGTVLIAPSPLAAKIQHGLVLSEQEDELLRTAVQQVNDQLSRDAGLSSSTIHYFFWNVFRNCCPRIGTHCHGCNENCSLPHQYKSMPTYHKKCVFSSVCKSVDVLVKVIEPPYIGHYY